MSVGKALEYTVQTNGERLDTFLSRESGESRAFIQRVIDEGGVKVNGTPRKANYKLKANDIVEFTLPQVKALNVLAEDLAIDIVYEDNDIIVVNKAQGMVVHPAPGNESGTLVNALLYSASGLSGIGGVIRPGIVHRIDKMTSGLIVAAKNDFSHASLASQLQKRDIHRIYVAIVEGNIKEDSGTIEGNIGRHPKDRKRMAVTKTGREAVTFWSVIDRAGLYTLIRAKLQSGRTHQIRVHMAYIKHPVAGDAVYGQSKPKLSLNGQALHACKLILKHPRTGEQLEFFAPPPEHFLKAMKLAGFNGAPEWEKI